MTWMIAEDETDIRNLLMMMFQVWGHSTVTYENGQKVWDWLDQLEGEKSPDPVPDLVLMDIRMPGKKGNEIAHRMRTIPALKTVPIILMTAYSLSDGEKTQMLQQDGVDHIIAKPLPDFEQLRVVLHNLLDKKNGSAA